MDSAPTRQGPRRLAIWEMCLLIAGIAVGFWLFGVGQEGRGNGPWFGLLIGVLGGMSLVGPPILLWERRRRRRKWGPGELLWFSTGISAWLLWPPIVISKLRPPAPPRIVDPEAMAEGCFLYGTPLMAVYVTSALLCGGWIRRRGRRRRRLFSWRERFGLVLGALWAATGLWVLYLIYGEKLR